MSKGHYIEGSLYRKYQYNDSLFLLDSGQQCMQRHIGYLWLVLVLVARTKMCVTDP